jgi:hypothetical protein
MVKKLLISLFKTFVISIILTIILNTLYYTITKYYATTTNDYDYKEAIPLIIAGAFFLNILLFILSLPLLFLSQPGFWNNKLLRLLLYFTGPILFIIAVLGAPMGETDKTVYFLTVLSFTVVHAILHYKLIKTKYPLTMLE